MMRVRLHAKNRIPHGANYSVTDPLTNQQASAHRFDLLLGKLKKARKANGIPIGLDFESEVEQWVCASYPQECEQYNPAIPQRPRSLGMGDVLRGTRVMLEQMLAGRPVENQEEANRRGSICASCPYNQPIQYPCGGQCGELKDLIRRVIGGATTPYDPQLQACFICGCELKTAIWTTLEVQCKPVDDQMKQQFASVPNCWKQCS